MYEYPCILHVNKDTYKFEQDIAVGDKLYLSSYDKPIKVYNRTWKNGIVHFYGKEA